MTVSTTRLTKLAFKTQHTLLRVTTLTQQLAQTTEPKMGYLAAQLGLAKFTPNEKGSERHVNDKQ
jgi:hypothetical protein